MTQPLHGVEEGFVPVEGGRVWYQKVGSGDAIPLLVLHGGPGWPHDYLESMQELADERPVVFYDQLGCGKSERPEDTSLWHAKRFVREVDQVREGLGLGEIYLLGHSWGGMLATDYALTQPSGLRKLILASPVDSVKCHMEGVLAYREALPEKVKETLEKHETAGTTDSDEYWQATMVFNLRHICRIDPWPDPMLRSVQGMGAPVYNTMWGPSEVQLTGNLADFERVDRLQEIKVPTLFTCGRFDECTPDAVGWYHENLPGSEFVVFEGSSHSPHLEEPDNFIRVIREFLRS